ncbi:GYDIA family GHMP kinase [Weeksellaceae bacterium KMM 9713]|uniref:GYDIA family GHMP kinase n=1 Tax=Profundicola chukchiensis TaxID=2961959 RepID=A0A9X4RXE9_9FLAO|nr:GYDIA family GHMP kinase [Profundicola chukchiensis]MDG4946782.1 GYDIA family GHMP kinase [Profundicola chukchiensis]
MQEYFANGKLLLSGEYVVLDGALAIGLPTKLGQKMKVEESGQDKTHILWKAYLNDDSLWFEAELNDELDVISSSDSILGNNISNILKAVESLKPEVFKNKRIEFTTQLEFPKDWGLGSSSTLVSLLSKYADIDAFKLLEKTFGGSGYDISCAMFPKPQSYQLTKKDRKVGLIQLDESITQHIYFVYLNEKQNSREGIERYREFGKDKDLIKAITDLSLQIKSCKSLEEFEDILYVHEYMISGHLEMDTVKESLFPDYKNGMIKSLGAWGGDFVLVTSHNHDMSYFERKGYTTMLSYAELIVD